MEPFQPKAFFITNLQGAYWNVQLFTLRWLYSGKSKCWLASYCWFQGEADCLSGEVSRDTISTKGILHLQLARRLLECSAIHLRWLDSGKSKCWLASYCWFEGEADCLSGEVSRDTIKSQKTWSGRGLNPGPFTDKHIMQSERSTTELQPLSCCRAR